MRITGARAFALDAPLTRPYELSFTTLTSFRMRLVEVTVDDARTGLGEVVALPGYGQESDADVAAALHAACLQIAGMAPEAAIAHAARTMQDTPFARSALISAIEDAISDPISHAIEWPQVGVLSATDPAASVRRAAELAAEGFATLKVKIGRDVATEIACARVLLTENPGVRYRFDANQAYTETDARSFVEALGRPDAVEHVEQPLAIDAWDAFAALAQDCPVPLMLDESILSDDDIDRAADVGADRIKLKLCKAAGVAGLLAQAAHARSLGLGVVMGNGVSGPIGNLAEARAWAADPGLWAGAGEANGFAKLAGPILESGPVLESGALQYPGGPARLQASNAAGGERG